MGSHSKLLVIMGVMAFIGGAVLRWSGNMLLGVLLTLAGMALFFFGMLMHD